MWLVATALDRAEDICCSYHGRVFCPYTKLKANLHFRKPVIWSFGTGDQGTGTELTLSQCCVWVY